jgi:hypothetical protein
MNANVLRNSIIQTNKKAGSFVIIAVTMKNLYLLSLLLLPIISFSQDLTGVWVGYIHNDSTNMNLYYEAVITQAKGKLKGYSYTNFVVDGRELTGVKTINVTKQGDKIYLEDDNLIFNDYPFAPPKGVRQLSVYERTGEDVLQGKFMTSRTKQYGRQVTGTIYLQRVKDFEAAKIYGVLKRMDLLAGLSFIEQKEDVAKLDEPKKTEERKQKEEPQKTEGQKKITAPVATIKETEETKPKTISSEPPKKKVDIKKEIEKRKIETIETVYYTSDSLVFEVYDNGYVDGDSVTVIVNNKELLSHIRLTEKSVRKTIYVTPESGDSLKVILFAENLGTIGPNTGMAVIYDGKRQYKIAFSGDLEKNAAIILRRKKSTQ